VLLISKTLRYHWLSEVVTAFYLTCTCSSFRRVYLNPSFLLSIIIRSKRPLFLPPKLEPMLTTCGSSNALMNKVRQIHPTPSNTWFRGVVGYHTSLTHLWSPVRARAKSSFLRLSALEGVGWVILLRGWKDGRSVTSPTKIFGFCF
jgi:hypothetical protein